MKASVIVLTYNQEQTIGRALDSVLGQQTDSDFEVIVGDDASTDSTRQICEDYARRFPDRVRLMPAAPNKGVARNYFDCLEAARGEYIADCAGDDAWSTTLKLAEQVAFLDAHPEVTAVHTSWREVGPDFTKTVVLPYPPVMEGREMLLKLLRHEKPQPMVLSTALYRRKVIMEAYEADKVAFRDAEAEDLSIMATLCCNGMIGYLPQPTLDYSVGGADTVSNPARIERAARFYVGALEQTLLIARKAGISLAEFAPALAPYYRYALSLACKSHNRDLIDRVEAARRAARLPHTLKSLLRSLLCVVR